MRSICFALAVCCYFDSTHAQTPDHRGEIATSSPSYRGEQATVPIQARHHVRNEEGSDGAGLCVISSAIANGMDAGIPGLDAPGIDEFTRRLVAGKGSPLWRYAKSRPGGYSPDKLAAAVDLTMPGELYASHVGTDPRILDTISRRGYAMGATMNTGSMYGYKPIHHMVSLIHYRTGGMACVVDNNDPGVFHWMPAREFDRRWIDNGQGWVWIWLRRRIDPQLAVLIAMSLLIASILLTARRRRISEESESDEEFDLTAADPWHAYRVAADE